MNALDETIIEMSKKKVLLLILSSFAMVALGTWLFCLDQTAIPVLRWLNNPTLVHVLIRGIGVVGIIFFGLSGIFCFKKLLDKRPGLVFNSSGIVDNSSGVSAGFIPWTEIIGVEIFEIHKQKFLIIKVKNPQSYLKRGGWMKRSLNRASFKMCGSPIAIGANAIKIDFSELLSLFSQYQQKYGNT
ncbi:MAG: hypothetical protein HZA50_15180 [Planctomycetes bacterium]|nr:hypothetical protein [Planctomycetota bacterium]